jgi:hypothetical protein
MISLYLEFKVNQDCYHPCCKADVAVYSDEQNRTERKRNEIPKT